MPVDTNFIFNSIIVSLFFVSTAVISCVLHCKNHFTLKCIAHRRPTLLRRKSPVPGFHIQYHRTFCDLLQDFLFFRTKEHGGGPFTWILGFEILVATVALIACVAVIWTRPLIAHGIAFGAWFVILCVEMTFTVVRRRIAHDLRTHLTSHRSVETVAPYLIGYWISMMCFLGLLLCTVVVPFWKFSMVVKLRSSVVSSKWVQVHLGSVILFSYLVLHSLWNAYCSWSFYDHVHQSFAATLKEIDPEIYHREMAPVKLNTFLTILSGSILTPFFGTVALLLPCITMNSGQHLLSTGNHPLLSQTGLLLFTIWTNSLTLNLCFDQNRHSCTRVYCCEICREGCTNESEPEVQPQEKHEPMPMNPMPPKREPCSIETEMEKSKTRVVAIMEPSDNEEKTTAISPSTHESRISSPTISLKESSSQKRPTALKELLVKMASGTSLSRASHKGELLSHESDSGSLGSEALDEVPPLDNDGHRVDSVVQLVDKVSLDRFDEQLVEDDFVELDEGRSSSASKMDGDDEQKGRESGASNFNFPTKGMSRQVTLTRRSSWERESILSGDREHEPELTITADPPKMSARSSTQFLSSVTQERSILDRIGLRPAQTSASMPIVALKLDPQHLSTKDSTREKSRSYTVTVTQPRSIMRGSTSRLFRFDNTRLSPTDPVQQSSRSASVQEVLFSWRSAMQMVEVMGKSGMISPRHSSTRDTLRTAIVRLSSLGDGEVSKLSELQSIDVKDDMEEN